MRFEHDKIENINISKGGVLNGFKSINKRFIRTFFPDF